MIIKNVQLYTEDKFFEEGQIIINDGLFSEEEVQGDEVIDGEGCYAIAGLDIRTPHAWISAMTTQTVTRQMCSRSF